jgi:serine protease Do
MKLSEKMRQQKLLSTTLMLFTLSLGIVIGTLLNTGVHAQRGQAAAPDATPLTIPKATAVGNEFTKLAKMLEPSVVNITADFTPKAQEGARKGRGPQGDDDGDDDSSDLFRRFFGGPGGGDQPQQSQRREQSGTGFIVDKNGYIVTNNHVVDGVDHIRVKLHGDETQYRARLIGADRETDVAVIKIDPKRPLAPVTIGNSDGVQVGDWAVAIGSPFGLEATVTAGIVSAMDRGDIGAQQFQKFIQTDAAINPGNSGGPLLNIRGEVIGVNTMIATQSGGYQGVGFALPVNMVVRVYNDIIRNGRVTRGSIGVSWTKTKSETLKALGVDHGVIVSEVRKDGPADKAGLKSDDIITGINGQAVKDGDDLVARVAEMPVGTPTTLTVDRDGKKMDFKLTIQDRTKVFADDPRIVGENAIPESATGKGEAQVKFGISIRGASEEEKETTPDKHGIAVTRVEPGSFAEDVGLMERDLIVSINRQQVTSVDDIRKIQQTLKPGDPVAFRVVRQIGGGRAKNAQPRTATMFLSGTLPQN